MNTSGWIKLHRSVFKNPIVMKDAEHLAVWLYLLTHAAHEPQSVFFNKRRMTLETGQVITSRGAIAKELHIEPNKVERILNLFEGEQQIEQRGNSVGRLISVLNWTSYQKSEQQSEQRANSKTNSRTNNRTNSEMNSEVNSGESSQAQENSVLADTDAEEVNSKVNSEVNSEVNSKTNSKVNTIQEDKENKRSIFVRPKLEEVEAYCAERRNGIDAQRFIDYYESNGWKVGRSPMKDWKAAVRNWERREGTKPKVDFRNSAQGQNYDFAEIERLLVGRGKE